MSERPKDGVDPDATVMIPAQGTQSTGSADDDATVMMPAQQVEQHAVRIHHDLVVAAF